MTSVRTPVSRLAEFVNGRAFKPDDFTETGLPVVRIRELLDPTADLDRFDGQVAARNLIHDGDLIFAWSATLAVRFWEGGPAILNQHLFNVHPHEGLAKIYLRWALDHTVSALSAFMHGSAMTHITKGMLKDVFIDLPPLEEQRQIAEYLDRETGKIDELIAKQERLVATLAERRQSLISRVIARGLRTREEIMRVGYGVSGGVIV